jgi:hypothetical protein
MWLYVNKVGMVINLCFSKHTIRAAFRGANVQHLKEGTLVIRVEEPDSATLRAMRVSCIGTREGDLKV